MPHPFAFYAEWVGDENDRLRQLRVRIFSHYLIDHPLQNWITWYRNNYLQVNRRVFDNPFGALRWTN